MALGIRSKRKSHELMQTGKKSEIRLKTKQQSKAETSNRNSTCVGSNYVYHGCF
jgi:hypothetical protein